MRKKPYTQIGLRRMQCSRAGCSNRATQQWDICSDGNVRRPICTPCDIELNRLVLEWMGFPDAGEKMKRYVEALS